MRTFLWSALFALALPVSASVVMAEDAPASAADAAIIDALIKQLGADDFRSREAASEKLAKLGRTARPALQKAAKNSESPEVRWRAEQLLKQMEGGAAEKPLGSDGDRPLPPTPTPGTPLPGSGTPVPSSPFGQSGDLAERMKKILEQLQKQRGRNPLMGGLFGSRKIEAPGLTLERISGGQVELKVRRTTTPDDAQVDDIYVGRSLSDILEAHPELAKHEGMEELKRKDAKGSWPGMDEFFKNGMPRVRIETFPGGNGFGMMTSSGVSISQGPDGVTVKITEKGEDGKPVTKEYKAATMEELKRKHPEIADKVGGFGVRVMPPNFFWPDRSKRRPGGLMPSPVTPRANPITPAGKIFGLGLVKPDDALASHLKLDRGMGAVVREVQADSPASRLGFERNDIIVAINGTPVTLEAAVTKLRTIGRGTDPVSVEIIRKGQKQTLSR